MALMLKVLEFLRMRMIRFARDCIKSFPGRWTSLLPLLSRKLIVWRLWFGTFGRPKSAKSPSLEIKASSYSVSGGSAVVRECVIAASYVPASASHLRPEPPRAYRGAIGNSQRPSSSSSCGWQCQSRCSAFGIFISYTRAVEPSTYE